MGTAYTDDASEENQIKLIVHRFNFYTHNIHIFTSDMHVSHFCHNKLCIRLNRLPLDLQSVKTVGRLSHWRGSV